MSAQPGWDRLAYTASGTITITSDRHQWTIPPHRGLWVPDTATLTMTNRYPVAVRMLYFATHLGAGQVDHRAVVLLGFARELLHHVARVCPLGDSTGAAPALLTVLLDQLRHLPAANVALPVPQGELSSQVAQTIRDNWHTPLSDIAAAMTLSIRTLERRFLAETGVPIGAWRRRARLLESLEALAADIPISQIGADIGYSTPSAYTAAFLREFGCTPTSFTKPT